jgi:hypothetical protein
MAAALRAAFTWLGRALGNALIPVLLAHRARVVSKFFELPIEL